MRVKILRYRANSLLQTGAENLFEAWLLFGVFVRQCAEAGRREMRNGFRYTNQRLSDSIHQALHPITRYCNLTFRYKWLYSTF